MLDCQCPVCELTAHIVQRCRDASIYEFPLPVGILEAVTSYGQYRAAEKRKGKTQRIRSAAEREAYSKTRPGKMPR
jgi:hypothetical protein